MENSKLTQTEPDTARNEKIFENGFQAALDSRQYPGEPQQGVLLSQVAPYPQPYPGQYVGNQALVYAPVSSGPAK